MVRYRFPIVAIGTVVLGIASARASELPSFELLGFPITPHQVALLGAENVQRKWQLRRSRSPAMPASSHQIEVLSPRADRFRLSMIPNPAAAQPRLTRAMGAAPRLRGLGGCLFSCPEN